MGQEGLVVSMNSRNKDDYLFVRVFGNGKKNLVAFHGYGQSGEVFKNLAASRKDITLYAFDLFYHGKSACPPPKFPLRHEQFGAIFEDFLRQTSLKRFEIAGFSMGGKYALSILSAYGARIDKLTLIAPDGIGKNFWYTAATNSAFTRRLFKIIINHPQLFFKSALLLDKFKLVDGRVRKFVIHEMNTPQKRVRVYNSWAYLRDFFVPVPDTATHLQAHNIKTELIIGKYDRIITQKTVSPLIDYLTKDSLKILNAGHSNMLQAYFESQKPDSKSSLH